MFTICPDFVPDILKPFAIFVDKSSIEIFANDGKDVFTLLTYPGEAQTGIELFAQKKGTKMELDAWMLKSIWR